jgi:hypothetical protein
MVELPSGFGVFGFMAGPQPRSTPRRAWALIDAIFDFFDLLEVLFAVLQTLFCLF